MSEQRTIALGHAVSLAKPSEGHADTLARAHAFNDFLVGATQTQGGAPAGKAPATAPAAGKAPATAPAAGKAPAAGNAPATAPVGKQKAAPLADAKAPDGKNTYQDVVNALTAVLTKVNKAAAINILTTKGGGVSAVRDLKPALYDSVVEACNEVVADDADADDGTGAPETDELGLPAG